MPTEDKKPETEPKKTEVKPEIAPFDPYFPKGDIEDRVSGTNKDFDDKVGPRPPY